MYRRLVDHLKFTIALSDTLLSRCSTKIVWYSFFKNHKTKLIIIWSVLFGVAKFVKVKVEKSYSRRVTVSLYSKSMMIPCWNIYFKYCLPLLFLIYTSEFSSIKLFEAEDRIKIFCYFRKVQIIIQFHENSMKIILRRVQKRRSTKYNREFQITMKTRILRWMTVHTIRND